MAARTSSKVRGRKGKIGKKKAWISAYFASGRPLFNKARRIVKHLRRYGKSDRPAQEALKVAVAGMPRQLSKHFD